MTEPIPTPDTPSYVPLTDVPSDFTENGNVDSDRDLFEARKFPEIALQTTPTIDGLTGQIIFLHRRIDVILSLVTVLHENRDDRASIKSEPIPTPNTPSYVPLTDVPSDFTEGGNVDSDRTETIRDLYKPDFPEYEEAFDWGITDLTKRQYNKILIARRDAIRKQQELFAYELSNTFNRKLEGIKELAAELRNEANQTQPIRDRDINFHEGGQVDNPSEAILSDEFLDEPPPIRDREIKEEQREEIRKIDKLIQKSDRRTK
jgi:hypothetical protein